MGKINKLHISNKTKSTLSETTEPSKKTILSETTEHSDEKLLKNSETSEEKRQEEEKRRQEEEKRQEEERRQEEFINEILEKIKTILKKKKINYSQTKMF